MTEEKIKPTKQRLRNKKNKRILVKFIDLKYAPKKKMIVRDLEKQKFYKHMAKYNPYYVVIYE